MNSIPDYSLNAVRKLLKKICIRHNTPNCLDYRRPENAEEILKKPGKRNKSKIPQAKKD